MPLEHVLPDAVLPIAERRQAGQALRKVVPRSLHASWKPPPNRADPVQTLIDSAQKTLVAHRRVRNYEQAADDSLTMSEQLWRAKQASCPEAPGTGTPLAALMMRLAQPAAPVNNN